jgi:GDPmannose 4,6-dehydratase
MADDFVIATGVSHSVRDLVTFSLRTVGLEDQFNTLVQIDSNLLRKNEVKSTVGDASKIKRKLDWSAKTSFEELISEMVEFDLEINAPKN